MTNVPRLGFRGGLLFAFFALLSFSVFAAPSVTIEQVLSPPFPSDLRASPTGGHVAWVLNARGVRNIWIAGPPDYQGRPLTSYTQDDGQELSNLEWSQDARYVVYVRGDNANGRGEFPNPLSNPAGIQQTVCSVSIGGGSPHVLGPGAAPAVSPDNKTIAFIWKGEVWTAALDGSGKAEQLIHARGRAEELRWSPDGRQLALVSDRGNHSFIAVYSIGDKMLNFLDASVDRDIAPVWSPDGKQLAFIRIPASKYAFAFGPVLKADPWSIRVADVSTAKGREVWKAQEGPGSAFFPVVAENALLWAAGDRLIFPWERDGWRHLYSTSLRDDGATPLTPGAFEVEHVTLSADRKRVIVSSNQGDIDRRHLWSVPVTGGNAVALTAGTGIETSPAAISGGDAVAFFHSDAQHPQRAAIQTASGIKDLAPSTMPRDFPASAMVIPQPVTISSADGMRIHGQLFLPPGGTGRHPAVIFFHGGSRRQMLLGWHYMFYYHQAYGFNQYLANKGYVVLSVNYRSGIGYGLNFREAKDYGATGASEYNDVIGAGLYLRGRSDVDPGRIGLWGGSYGGYLTALGLARASDLFAAGVDLHGVHDWNLEVQNFVPSYDPEKQKDAAKVAFESSPMAYVGTWKSPVLLIHGDDDRNVPFAESVMLAEALRKQGVPFEQLIFPDEVHDFLVYRHWVQAYQAADEFFARYLKP